MNKIISAALVLIALSACQKKDDTTPDAGKVEMNITSPQPGQVFRNGDTVYINATVSYPSELHGYEVKIEDTATGITLYDDDQHVHTDHFVIADKWVGTSAQPATLKLTLITEIDHDGNEARKSLIFSLKP